jgi:CRP/FNR family transcriptional regulator, cyclic AMP receptor protein
MSKTSSDLRELQLFSDVSRKQLTHIKRQLTPINLPAGRVLVHEGAPGDEFMIIVDGEAEVSKGGQTIATIGRGDLVGEMALIEEGGQHVRNATVTAKTDVTIQVGSRREFREMILCAPSVAEKVQSTVASRLRSAA